MNHSPVKFIFGVFIILGLGSCKSHFTQALNTPIKDIYFRDSSPLISNKASYFAIIFYSPTCPICKSIAGEVLALRAAYTPAQLHLVLAVSKPCIPDTSLLFDQFAGSKIPIAIVLDDSFKLAKALCASTNPEVFILNRKGEVLYKGLLNDYYKSIGIHANQIKRHYALETMQAIMLSKPIRTKYTKAIGCNIEFE